jgi:protein subunit release factor B
MDASRVMFKGVFMINENDIEELFIRSSGPGGQNVNKVSTCVVLKHRLTGIIVKCQEFRTQHQNRERARELLVLQLERRRLDQQNALKSAREKKRRQLRGRSKAGKVKVLEQKKRVADKKRTRSRVLLDE